MSLEFGIERHALARVRGKPERLVRLSKRFLEDIPQSMNEFKVSVGEGDFATARRVAHTVKGVAANMSAGVLRQVAFRAEQAAEAMDAAALNVHMFEVEQASSELIAELEGFIAEAEPRPTN